MWAKIPTVQWTTGVCAIQHICVTVMHTNSALPRVNSALPRVNSTFPAVCTGTCLLFFVVFVFYWVPM